MKKVLVIGGGGREHAIVDALSRSPQVGKIYCAPGNAGIADQAECVPIKDTDVPALLSFAKENRIDLTVVGPEAALAAGIVDAFREAGLKIFGHSKNATRIESSKEFAKIIMEKYGIPTSGYRSFDNYSEALEYVKGRPFPAVLKYDGLAAGKGVVIAQTPEEADAALRDMLLDGHFGKGRVVVEDFLQGPEFSFMAFVRGTEVRPMILAQDHKRAFDGDKGPNTGGMGAYTPLPFITEGDKAFAMKNILQATASGMAAEGCPLSGVLYAGLMKTAEGIKVIEFNARFGDPETEVVLPLYSGDIYTMFDAVASMPSGSPIQPAMDLGRSRLDGTATSACEAAVDVRSPGCSTQGAGDLGRGPLDGATAPTSATAETVILPGDRNATPLPEPEWEDCCAVGVVLASKGYPGSYSKGSVIEGLEDIDGTVFHMGTAVKDGKLVTAGGRVLFVVCKGKDLLAARAKANEEVRKVRCDNLFHRSDIGYQIG